MDEFNDVIQDVVEAGLLEQWLTDTKYKATRTAAKVSFYHRENTLS
jgi:uncharacterized protein YaaQ